MGSPEKGTLGLARSGAPSAFAGAAILPRRDKWDRSQEGRLRHFWCQDSQCFDLAPSGDDPAGAQPSGGRGSMWIQLFPPMYCA